MYMYTTILKVHTSNNNEVFDTITPFTVDIELYVTDRYF